MRTIDNLIMLKKRINLNKRILELMNKDRNILLRAVKQIHDELDCRNCSFADQRKINIDSCCTYPGKLQIEAGECLCFKPIDEQ